MPPSQKQLDYLDNLIREARFQDCLTPCFAPLFGQSVAGVDITIPTFLEWAKENLDTYAASVLIGALQDEDKEQFKKFLKHYKYESKDN